MIDETRKILHEPELKVTATCARVPVQDSHSVEIDVTLDKEATVQEIKDLFDKDERVVLVDNPEKMNILRHLTLLVEMKYLQAVSVEMTHQIIHSTFGAHLTIY